MEGPISFWGYKEQESNLILPERDDDEQIFHHECGGSSLLWTPQRHIPEGHKHKIYKDYVQ